MGDVMSLDQLDKMTEKLNALSAEIDGLSAKVSELLGVSFLDALSQAKVGYANTSPGLNTTILDVSGKGLFFGCGGINGYSTITVYLDGVQTKVGGSGLSAGVITSHLAAFDRHNDWSIRGLSGSSNEYIYSGLPIIFESSLKITVNVPSGSGTDHAYMYTLL